MLIPTSSLELSQISADASYMNGIILFDGSASGEDIWRAKHILCITQIFIIDYDLW